jgi:hypothetical protein
MHDLRTTTATLSRGTGPKGLFVLLGVVDLVLTLWALENGFVELNPVFRGLQDNLPGLLLMKVAVPLGIAWAVPARLLLPSIALLLAVLGWNLGELAGLG